MSLKDKVPVVPVDKTDSMNINLIADKKTSLNVEGRIVEFIEYEPAQEGDFVKVCTDDHSLGVAAEYVWFQNKYPNAVLTLQDFTTIKLNGNNVKCDILTIETAEKEIKTIYFDISQMLDDLNKKVKIEK
jgi:hypothetical protein